MQPPLPRCPPASGGQAVLADPVQNPFRAELLIPARTSLQLLAFIACLHGLTAIAACLMPLALHWKIILCLLIGASAAYYGLLHSGQLPRHSLASAKWREFGGWEVATPQGEQLAAILLDSSFSNRWLTVLNFKARNGRRFVMVVLADNLDAASAKNLRRRFRLLR